MHPLPKPNSTENSAFRYSFPGASGRVSRTNCEPATCMLFILLYFKSPKTDSYKIGPLQRAHSGQAGKNMTLLKKYSPILPQEGILKHQQPLDYDRNSKSLPLKINADDNKIKPDKMHRSRTNSELSKRKAEGMFIHVKGKRKAPQPPEMIFSVSISLNDEQRLAARNPSVVEMYNGLEKPIISNDCLKLENGILTPLKENLKQPNNHLAICSSPSKSNTFKETFPPRPWYKRNSINTDFPLKKENNSATLDMWFFYSVA
ncbi:hypothetical protein HUJ05_009719 [Dendroctonus ponderosae]|nr:hypothetical protein HUJ05_009719 [Dendroctonus ponderosae]